MHHIKMHMHIICICIYNQNNVSNCAEWSNVNKPESVNKTSASDQTGGEKAYLQDSRGYIRQTYSRFSQLNIHSVIQTVI